MPTNIMEKNILIDFHAHILPGMDHGCEDTAMAVRQLKMAAEQGIDIIIATSHFYPHMESVNGFLSRREEAWDELKAVWSGVRPEIRLGAEVLACNNIDQMPGIEKLCVENSKLLLLEMPTRGQWGAKLIEAVVRLRDKKGLEVILAHGERYEAEETQKLLRKGFQLQLNAASLAKLVSSGRIKGYINGHHVAAFGSDIHGLRNHYKAFARAMKKWGPEAERVMELTSSLLAVQTEQVL